MDDSSINSKSRRSLLKRAVLLTGMTIIPILAYTRTASAYGKLAKADANYQEKPNAGKDCDDCLQFIPGATRNANGTCEVVEGAISPHGYCALFARKPKRG